MSPSIEDYRSIIGEEEVEGIKAAAEEVSGLSLVHVNSTRFGGGVAEILHSMVPLMKSVGLEARWEVMKGDLSFFTVTKKLHNALQGADIHLSREELELYMRYNKASAEELELDADFIVVHDYQPMAIPKYSRPASSTWIWRCHIDLSTPQADALKLVSSLIPLYSAAVFSMKEFARGLKLRKLAVIPPSIDPLSDKNKPLPESEVLRVLERYDIDPDRPIMTQVARFDPWKDPLGAVDAYRIVKREVPGVQLLMVASMASDDPEGWYWYEKVARYVGEDYDVHLLTNMIGVGSLEVNALQRASDVAVLKSIREGFGLSVAEALWKKVPVVASSAGGIKLQVIDGVTGFIVSTVQELAEKVLYLLKHPEEARRMGANGAEHVRRNFLITRHLKDYLKLISSLKSSAPLA